MNIPPTALLEHYNILDVTTLSEEIEPEFILAITRHSENHPWQTKYQELLKNLTPADFEERKITTYAVDTHFIEPLFNKNKHHIKPWRLSHSKESGVVMIFTLKREDEMKTPCLLQIAVFLHYMYEVMYASHFFKSTTVDVDFFGTKVSKFIKGNEKGFSFLTDKNTYSETLYWDLAIKKLIEKWCPVQLQAFKNSSIITDTKPIPIYSLNIVDMLWNINLSNVAGEYFQNENLNFTYHFMQSLWSKIIYTASPHSKEKIHEILIQNLEKNDDTITKLLLQKEN
jgi:hypothetical protein